MKKIRSWLIPVMLLSTIFLCRASWAAKAYITESKEVGLRSGPSIQNRIMLNLQPGSVVEVLKANEWTHVRVAGPSGDSKEGWVPSRALGSKPPEETLMRELQNENSALNDKLVAMEKEKADLRDKEKALTQKVGKLESDYEKLKSGSSNYVGLLEEYEATKSNLTQAQENIHALVQENENLKLSQRVMMFGAGAFVLFCGWLVGWLTGRHQKKRRAFYFM